jgi:methyl-accepting chemotaxis protein
MNLIPFRRPTVASVAVTIAPPANDVESSAVPDEHAARMVRELATKTAGIGKEAAALGGIIDDTVGDSTEQVKAFDGLAEKVNALVAANQDIAGAVSESRKAADAAREHVERVGHGVEDTARSLRDVAGAAEEITRIAMQTRLVAFNASVEAKRAGEAGRGFGVVAVAVKDLAQQVEASSKSIMTTLRELDKRIERLARELRDSGDAHHDTFHAAFREVETRVQSIAQAAAGSEREFAEVMQVVRELQTGFHASMQRLDGAKRAVDHFRGMSEDIIEIVADSGFETEDSAYIEAVVGGAQEIGRLFSQAVADRRISLDQLFDQSYREIPGSNPVQYLTGFVALTDDLLPPIQEGLASLTPKVVFCAAVDRNGFLPTHNRKFSHPQGADPVWNAANCRNRRLFNDKTGLAAGRSQRKFLLQTYRRDMGGGKFVLMKDLSAPIFVDGRHWGGLRLAYQF